MKAHPVEASIVLVGTGAMLVIAIWAAPALTAVLSAALLPSIGSTAAGILGTAIGGALASGVRSLLVYSTPMVTGVDPFNFRQLGTDVGMSSTFGFFGFAQAAALTSVTAAMGVTGFALFLVNCVGLIGYEMFKDYLQNRIRSRVANDPKNFKDIWRNTLAMNTTCNLHRCIPGFDLATNFAAKVIADVIGTIWWDRIVNKRNEPQSPESDRATREQLQAA